MDRVALTDRSAILRAELKQWEKQFAAAHGGRKATREEIKEDGDVAAKYKEYHKTQDTLSGKAGPPKSPKKRKAPVASQNAPSPKRQRSITTTPTKFVSKFIEVGLDDSPASAAVNATPAMKRTSVGPTPQKDGLVLGLFDLLPVLATPSKTQASDNTVQAATGGALKPVSANILLSTPQKRLHSAEFAVAEDDANPIYASTQKPARTPQSASKRYLLDTFLTPSKRRKRDSDSDIAGARDPSSANRHLSTPAFLRRDSQSISLGVIAEEEVQGGASPSNRGIIPSRWQGHAKRRLGFGKSIGMNGRKSLSSMIADLRRQEDERLDEEMDVLREMEGFGSAGPESSRKDTGQDVLVEDSQAAVALGPDGAAEQSEDQHAAVENSHTTSRIWKKRGQKRQTRRVIMRPVTRTKSSGPAEAAAEQSKDSDAERDAIVPETQFGHPEADAGSNHSDPGPDGPLNPEQGLEQSEVEQSKNKTTGEGIIKKTARKISATAHANFRRLKIRSRNSGGKGGRFGRRR